MWETSKQDNTLNLNQELPPLETYQKEAIKYIDSKWDETINTLCILDVGMGKTRIACEVIAKYVNRNAEKRVKGYVLICCSTTGVRDSIWIETLRKCNIENPIILEGETLKEEKLIGMEKLSLSTLNVYLITYANICRKDKVKYFLNNPPAMMVFDEFHTLTNNALKKNHKYRNAILELPYNLRFGLTATPFINDKKESAIAYGLLNDSKLVRDFYQGDKQKEIILLRKAKQTDFHFYRKNDNLPHTLF
jgi:superfamily II DNA or RNA helicase